MRRSLTSCQTALTLCAVVALCASIVALSACAVAPRQPARQAFVPPVLTLDELRGLSVAASASGNPRRGAHRAFAGIICHARGYRTGGDSFADCQALVAEAARQNPEALTRAQLLASIANQLVAPARGEPVPLGSRPGPVVQQVLCYDLSNGQFTDCEDI